MSSALKVLGQHEVGALCVFIQGNNTQQPVNDVSGIVEVGNIPAKSM